MPMSPLLRLACRLAALAATVQLVLPAQAASCETPQRLRYSMVPEGNVAQDLLRFQPLLKSLGTTLGVPVDVLTPSSYATVIEGLLSGSVDVARLGPSSYVSARGRDPGVTPFATFAQKQTAFQEEGPFYHSLLVVLAKGPFRMPGQLKGASVALVDPNSTSGNVIPRRLFGPSLGVPFASYFGRISYAGSHQGAAGAVLEQRVDAAFVSSLHLSKLIDDRRARMEDFRILWRSQPIPMDPFVYRASLCPEMKAKIRAAFLEKSVGASGVLDEMHATRFLGVKDSDYDVIRRIEQRDGVD